MFSGFDLDCLIAPVLMPDELIGWKAGRRLLSPIPHWSLDSKGAWRPNSALWLVEGAAYCLAKADHNRGRQEVPLSGLFAPILLFSVFEPVQHIVYYY